MDPGLYLKQFPVCSVFNGDQVTMGVVVIFLATIHAYAHAPAANTKFGTRFHPGFVCYGT